MSTKTSSTKIVQKIVIPKGVLDPNRIAVIEIPQSLYEASTVVVIPNSPFAQPSYTTVAACDVKSRQCLQETTTYTAVTPTSANRSHYQTAIRARKNVIGRIGSSEKRLQGNEEVPKRSRSSSLSSYKTILYSSNFGSFEEN